MYLAMMIVLIGSMALGNAIMLSILYGPRAVIKGEIWIVRGRTYIEMSNGDRYSGFWVFLRCIAIFATLSTVGFALVRAGRWTYARSSMVRRIIARFAQAIESKPPA